MKLATLKRIFRAGFLNFWRNGFVTLSSILMMTVTLFTLGVVLFTWVILNTTLSNLRDKADMSIYFTTTAPVDEIMALQTNLNALSEVATTTYTSADEELAEFQTRHQNDQLTLQALNELGSNPLGAVLEVKAKNINQYGTIATYVQQQQAVGSSTNANYSSIIDHVDYFDEQHQQAIATLSDITGSAEKLGLVVVVILILTTLAISFNTIRLGIYTARDEISVMRLVGAAGGYIRAPFVVEGVFYGIFAGLLSLALLYPLAYWLGQATQKFFGDINVYTYYVGHFGLLFLIIVGAGVALGAIASFLAVRRYLKV
ncbi:MAG: cell division protein FtsX [Minisyncoccia bacterium]